METEVFIITAYAITGALLAGLCLTTWHAARRARAQMQQRDSQ